MRNSSAEPARDRASWRRENEDGSITLEIHAQPGAKRSEVAGVHGDALKVRVAAPPVEGKANAALIAFLAEVFGVTKGNVTILWGDSGRRKSVRVEAPRRRPDREWSD